MKIVIPGIDFGKNLCSLWRVSTIVVAPERPDIVMDFREL
jgi:hypothetical protein